MIYFFKVIYVGEQVKKSNHSSRNLNYALHQLIWVLWQWLMIFNIAPLIAWQRQLPKKLQLSLDSSKIIGSVTPFCISLLCICNNIVDRMTLFNMKYKNDQRVYELKRVNIHLIM
ncbi:uncharacterized protein LOC106868956 [Octopus bimaculoides]|uniref:uncharacterized protein LOC106868956 n=1 Tax=Octopus bimaculoides TaxID=37653 RepID=UPI0022E21E9F|nr:uncharacterized protein LOC106868956 [Octopus bimaculoides]